ncbi:MAG: hypothetical protein A2X61_16320 [Ignavibacteria bacterium GWB2_35_12]|nr:MAG: hypothetical protein A2X63_13240 [Ignavibacteria bacterium GWA2_35_8]OGU39962.1 MAG: hypothetical protein A2X61_16320 [Ignavibacteria bacterium GWB2_35_12]OGU86271.1 MAG: hypothetical protein A2220_10205 [Ignavibacteria bacterium RIFOXYA2_FULL_35_10]OGV21850.1 MAG: hypothetical protein A2475_11130 [Ignavibacteria bacterium RIFOXYC2_FULL_35_21]
MPGNINNENLDSFLKSHLKSVPERELSNDDEKEMISNIILKTTHQKSAKQNIFSMSWIQAKELSRNVYDNFRIGRFQVLSPQFGLPLLLIIAVSVFLVMIYTGTQNKKDIIITEKQRVTYHGNQKQIKSNDINKHDLATLDNENHIQSTKLESIPLVYFDRGSTQDNSTIDKKRKAAFSVIVGVLQENGIEITKLLNDSLLISEWVHNTKNTNTQQRLVFQYNPNTTNVDVKIQKKTKEVAIIKKKNLEKIYKNINSEIFQIIKLSN